MSWGPPGLSPGTSADAPPPTSFQERAWGAHAPVPHFDSPPLNFEEKLKKGPQQIFEVSWDKKRKKVLKKLVK